ncbi:MAG TPA: FKBP-type peptidyl-prolyl cis-trans isomerase [Candidatus Thalassarchaeaceae archaeon]|jgi:FKBP-type peptidyl-prolyl cis-trans isomerase SlyD|nr:FKBP-type peptidyl-prolyl cis-trans isomerase [Candidatus Thalassarchaeaceae archaeon]HJL59526.1 FKBP-type peptidyl-prolyl cis-trans isomerase [Candidatus Thalassarchaeaceae archaeon]HJM19893.1 FKBP-type peptidyl-prolyl cis-trans isomerase [Candidatus Thalassarchaeaceae archaeon]HJM87873.1 FKBP-type peptidyl-prolyl cis-trans isomerase [Candidatus Thalassarchaeaceae archaeon]
MSTIEKDTVAMVHYRGTFPEDGEEFDSSHGSEPLAYLVGHQGMIPGFEREMMGAEVGEKREFTLMAEDAYGEQTDDAIMDIPASEFPDELELELGMSLMSAMGMFRIVGLTEDIVKCDFNHMLAGRALKFEVEVVEVREPSEEELAHGHVHGIGGHEH